MRLAVLLFLSFPVSLVVGCGGELQPDPAPKKVTAPSSGAGATGGTGANGSSGSSGSGGDCVFVPGCYELEVVEVDAQPNGDFFSCNLNAGLSTRRFELLRESPTRGAPSSANDYCGATLDSPERCFSSRTCQRGGAGNKHIDTKTEVQVTSYGFDTTTNHTYWEGLTSSLCKTKTTAKLRDAEACN